MLREHTLLYMIIGSRQTADGSGLTLPPAAVASTASEHVKTPVSIRQECKEDFEAEMNGDGDDLAESPEYC